MPFNQPLNQPLRELYACELDYRRHAGHATSRAPSLASRTRSATPPTYLMPAGFGSLQTQRGRRDHEERLTEALALASECQAVIDAAPLVILLLTRDLDTTSYFAVRTSSCCCVRCCCISFRESCMRAISTTGVRSATRIEGSALASRTRSATPPQASRKPRRCRPDTPRDGGACGVPVGLGVGVWARR